MKRLQHFFLLNTKQNKFVKTISVQITHGKCVQAGKRVKSLPDLLMGSSQYLRGIFVKLITAKLF